jgi:hypothetical protein
MQLDAGYVRTYPVHMNLTLSIDERLVEQARTIAAGRGKSLNQLIRDLLEAETGMHDGAARAAACARGTPRGHQSRHLPPERRVRSLRLS